MTQIGKRMECLDRGGEWVCGHLYKLGLTESMLAEASDHVTRFYASFFTPAFSTIMNLLLNLRHSL